MWELVVGCGFPRGLSIFGASDWIPDTLESQQLLRSPVKLTKQPLRIFLFLVFTNVCVSRLQWPYPRRFASIDKVSLANPCMVGVLQPERGFYIYQETPYRRSMQLAAFQFNVTT